MDGRTLARLARETYAKWSTDDGWLYAAAMAAFAALALAPLLLITLRIAEAFGTERAVLHGLALVIDPIVGHGGVRSLDGIAAHGQGPAGGLVPTALASVIAATTPAASSPAATKAAIVSAVPADRAAGVFHIRCSARCSA